MNKQKKVKKIQKNKKKVKQSKSYKISRKVKVLKETTFVVNQNKGLTKNQIIIIIMKSSFSNKSDKLEFLKKTRIIVIITMIVSIVIFSTISKKTLKVSIQ